MPNILILIYFLNHGTKRRSCFAGLSILFVEEIVKCQQTRLTAKRPLHNNKESLRWLADIKTGPKLFQNER